MDPAKIEAIRNWPDLKNVHEVRSFLGPCSYYRRYVRKFAEIASPLHMLTQRVPFSWGAREVTAFQTLKDKMTTGPVLILPDLQKSFEKQLSEKQMRWANILSQLHFQIVHVQGQNNVVADALSWKPLVQAIFVIHHSSFEDMVDQYATDTEFADIFTRIRDGEIVAGFPYLSVCTFLVGVIPKIIALKVDLPDVSLAISLHAPTQELRAEIVPAARAFPLSKLIAAVDSYLVESKSKVFIEYVMLAAVNDGEVHAHQMGKLLHGRKVVVNLIPYNPTTVTTQFGASGSTEVHKFQKILKEVYGLRTTVRQEMGQDIEGACGQLHVSHLSNKSSKANPAVRDIEDFGHGK
ncbi:hypothetical protein L7F22_038216 [Adiantum nelumboides]|nr:hypothetical protein [Adiantum nelumboides]